MAPESILTHLDIMVAAIAVLSALKSAYNGWARSMIDNIQMIPDVYQRQKDIADTQERLVDAVIALSIAEAEEDRGVDPREVEDNLRENGSERDFLRDLRPPESPYADVEDEEEMPEEELRWRQHYDD